MTSQAGSKTLKKNPSTSGFSDSSIFNSSVAYIVQCLVVPFSWLKRCPENEHAVKLNKQNPSVGLTKTGVPLKITLRFHTVDCMYVTVTILYYV